MDQELSGAFKKLDDLMGAGIINEADYLLRKDELIEKYMAGQNAGAAPVPPPVADMGFKPMCSIHNKARSITCLEVVGTQDDGTPVYACTAASQCKVQVPDAAGAVAPPPAVKGGKGAWGGGKGGYKRPFQETGAVAAGYGAGAGGYGAGGGGPLKRPRGAVTTWGGQGGWQQEQNSWNQGGWQGQGQGSWGSDAWETPMKAMCQRHGKQRSTGSMMNTGSGWVCRDDAMCKVGEPGADGGSVFVCVTHNRARASNYLEQQADGTWSCKPGKECKVSAKPDPVCPVAY